MHSTTTLDTLEFPAFLDCRGKPGRKFRARRWKRMPPAARPEGERWQDAERWEVYVDFTLCPSLAAGTRLLWVVEGRKWAYLRDAEAMAKLPLADWQRMARNGRKVSP